MLFLYKTQDRQQRHVQKAYVRDEYLTRLHLSFLLCVFNMFIYVFET